MENHGVDNIKFVFSVSKCLIIIGIKAGMEIELKLQSMIGIFSILIAFLVMYIYEL